MIILLLEREDNLINSFLDKIYSKVPKSCRQMVNKKTTHDMIKSYKQPPLLAAGWLLLVSKDVTDSQIKLLASIEGQNIILFKTNTRKLFNEIKENLTALSINYRIIDNYEISKSVIVGYIQSNLDISEADAKYLARRQGYYLRSIVSSVYLLSSFGKIDRQIIKKFTSENDNIPLYEIFNYVYKLPDCKLSYRVAVKLVYQYRYGFGHIIKYLYDTSIMYLHIFEFMVDGRLTLQNYKDFRVDTQDTVIKGITEYQLFKIVSHFELISVEYLYFIIQSVSVISFDVTGIPDFINFLKLIS